MNTGERAIVREERRLEKERKRRIEIANKMLIPVGGKTQESLKLLAFDPEGVFRLTDNRWLRVYEISGAYKELVDAATRISGRIRITFNLSESGRVTCHFTLMETGEIYEEIRQKMTADEKELAKVCNIRVMNVDEVMNHIAANFYQDIRFSYAAYVRGKKDWKKECFFEPMCEAASFKVGRLYGESLSVLEFPHSLENGVIDNLKSLGCPMFVIMDLNSLTDEEQLDFKRALEKKYNRRLSVNEDEDYINLSLSIILLCDSEDARKIVEETLISVFLKFGVVIAPSFHNQKQVLESSLSLGLMDYKAVRNVKTEVAKALLGGESDDA